MRPQPAIAIAAVATSLLLLAACSGKAVSNYYQVIDGSKWDRDTEYSFSFMIDDVSEPYNIVMEVRHHDAYPFHNLWIFCTEESPVGLLLHDTVECRLADEHGRWTGRGLSLREAAFPIRRLHRFPIRGQYTFGIRHGMRGEALTGIREIGIRIEK
ncbi:MAG: gliding motility lipoprotein GldH [Tannerellaceae bacterium]|jgi:gliding motility-associated lipoprotein GldH|nr:gliding motility lipoprotein GldH [Tannerellaceae bacterium]